ncbi:hypothetical protein BP6252_10812 [Coleophoma cylindrospora]|uniref:Biotrophy-associated secreted protein 2 n=1 Tax=Coleophoma cylindrospora TaxID=1849047 RepID=A0A3D8QN95_9HELO|nr:hypothetical protein BP6252_10812 [Coleophoma cylindrospora]
MVYVNSIVAILALSFSTALAVPGPYFPNVNSVSVRAAGGNVTTVNAGAAAVGKGGCINDADCGTQCCAGGAISGSTGRAGVGVCSGKGAGVEFQKGKTGCGFQDPNAQLTLQEAAAQVKKQGF